VSAWIVSDRHIDVLVRALGRRELVSGPYGPTQVGRVLWRENVKSIHAGYPDTEENDDNYPGTFEGWSADEVDRYEYQVPADETQDPGRLLVTLDSYRYQSCEHRGWKQSTAYAWVQALQAALEAEGAVELPSGSPEGSAAWSVPWREKESAAA
jgi:hypothetical protein